MTSFSREPFSLTHSLVPAPSTEPSRPLFLLQEKEVSAWLEQQATPLQKRWAEEQSFTPKPESFLVLPDETGAVASVLVVIPEKRDLWSLAFLPHKLPLGLYHIEGDFSDTELTELSLGWFLETYRFDHYQSVKSASCARLVVPSQAQLPHLNAFAEAFSLTRDLINCPPNLLGPDEIATEAKKIALKHNATYKKTTGEVLKKSYPLLWTVGDGSARPPCLVDLQWTGQKTGKKLPLITLVGKGIVFDTGGYNLKPGSGMALMKKDMGGAAQTLALAQLIMALNLPVRLRLFLCLAENSVSDRAFRPQDVLTSRSGLTVEIGNTDAEGRLAMADALFEACEDDPDLLIDCATLTGAARVALGTEIPAFFCAQEEISSKLTQIGQDVNDPLWPLPLYAPYRSFLSSNVADLNNIGTNGGYGGAITAGLFLQSFVKPTTPWIHVDFMGWNQRPRPGRPVGGEAMGLRALFALIDTLAQEHAVENS